jgi:hypothetical protein
VQRERSGERVGLSALVEVLCDPVEDPREIQRSPPLADTRGGASE